MKVEILSIGTELLLGYTINTNSAWLSHELAKIGVDVFYHTTVGDNASRIQEFLALAHTRSDGVIVTGGLGPTEDDLTCRAIADFAGRGLVFHPSISQKIRATFKQRHLSMARLNDLQAYLPESAQEIPNPVGTAPGFVLRIPMIRGTRDEGRRTRAKQRATSNNFLIIALPGVPREMKAMFEQSIHPYLVKQRTKKEVLLTHTLRTVGLPESTVAQRVQRWLKLKPPVTLGIYAHLGEVDLRIMSKGKNKQEAQKGIRKIEREIKPKIKKILFGMDEQTLEQVVVERLIAQRKTVAVAESCTGGLLAHRITNVSGSSKTFQMGLVLYSNQEKTNQLGIPSSLIKKEGDVSKPVALLMARRIREQTHTDYGISITGIAGPTGGTPKKPVGLVYIALASSKKTIWRKLYFRGNRQEIKWQATQAALDLLRRSSAERVKN